MEMLLGACLIYVYAGISVLWLLNVLLMYTVSQINVTTFICAFLQ
jgi:hypothetical protein